MTTSTLTTDMDGLKQTLQQIWTAETTTVFTLSGRWRARILRPTAGRAWCNAARRRVRVRPTGVDCRQDGPRLQV